MYRFKISWLLFLLFPLTALGSVSVKTYIPKNAFEHLPTVKKEQERLMPGFKYPEYFGGLIEHESCISLTHSRCWNSKSQLKTKRELGIGLGQMTKAYNANGTIRFDSLTNMRRIYASELKELTWSNIAARPDLQIRALILMTMGNYNRFQAVKDEFERLAMTDAAYNGGLGHTLRERQQCGLKKNCDPQKWFGNVEKIVIKSTKPLYAGRSAYDINRHHVTDVLYIRMPKYIPYLNADMPVTNKSEPQLLNLNQQIKFNIIDWLVSLYSKTPNNYFTL